MNSTLALFPREKRERKGNDHDDRIISNLYIKIYANTNSCLC